MHSRGVPSWETCHPRPCCGAPSVLPHATPRSPPPHPVFLRGSQHCHTPPPPPSPGPLCTTGPWEPRKASTHLRGTRPPPPHWPPPRGSLDQQRIRRLDAAVPLKVLAGSCSQATTALAAGTRGASGPGREADGANLSCSCPGSRGQPRRDNRPWLPYALRCCRRLPQDIVTATGNQSTFAPTLPQSGPWYANLLSPPL